MSLTGLYRHTLTVKRAVAGVTNDDYGHPVTTTTTVATVRGLVQPRSAREVALASQAGAAIGDHAAYIDPLSGIDTQCWVEVDGHRYDVVTVVDAAGQGHHLEIGLRRVA